jgi:ABC-type multidrug transport system ATPase subunit
MKTPYAVVLLFAFWIVLGIALALYSFYKAKSIIWRDFRLREYGSHIHHHNSHEEVLHVEKEAEEVKPMLSNLAKASLKLDTNIDHHPIFQAKGPEKVPEPEEFTFDPIKEPLTISFDSLQLHLKSNNASLLRDVFGSIKSFSITALMGPSGAGKTTLLALLRGQAHYAATTGTIKVNGKVVHSLLDYQSEMAFVAQDDIVYEELTVEDNILYSALLFNKRGYRTLEEIMPMVVAAEKILGIDFIRYSVVGSAAKKGISGGQKKRLSIAMEMTKEAAMFFLDEPTSGLDSATSISVLNSLHRLSSLGVNIVATLHQPRQEILDLLNSIILLAPGGRVAYFGPTKDIKSHFSQFGYHCPNHSNVADFIMDSLAGFVVPEGAQSKKPVSEVISFICDNWVDKQHLKHLKYLENEKDEIANHLRANRPDANVEIESNRAEESRLQTFLKTVYVVSSRQKKSYNRTFDTMIITCAILAFSGFAVGFMLGSVQFSLKNSVNVVQQTIFGQLVFSIFMTNFSLRLFGQDELMRNREENGGIWLFPYFIGKIASSFFELCTFPFAYICGYYSVISSNTSFLCYWAIFIAIHVALSAISNLISICLTGKIKDLMTLGTVVVLWLFGGVQPPYPKLPDVAPVIGPILNGMSPFRWSFQLQVLLETEGYEEVWDEANDKLYDTYGYNMKSKSLCAGMLVAYWAIVNVLAYAALVIKRDNFLLLTQVEDYLLARLSYKNGATVGSVSATKFTKLPQDIELTGTNAEDKAVENL